MALAAIVGSLAHRTHDDVGLRRCLHRLAVGFLAVHFGDVPRGTGLTHTSVGSDVAALSEEHLAPSLYGLLHRLAQSGIGIALGARDTPGAQQAVGGITVGADEGDGGILPKRQQLALVLEQDEGLGRKVAGHLAMSGGEEVLSLLGIAHVAMAVGVVKEAHHIFRFQHAAAGIVNHLLGNFAFLDQCLQVLHIAAGTHVHVGTGLHGQLRVVLQVAEAVARHLGNAGIVRHDESAESPGAAQHVVQQPAVGGGMLAIDEVEARHHAAHTGLHRSLVRREALVEHTQVAHVHRIIVTSGLDGSVQGIVLQAGHEIVHRREVALISAYQGLSDESAQIGILAVTLGDTSPAGVECDVHHRAVRPVDAVRRGLLGCDACSLLDGCRIPAAGLGQRNGEDGLVAMNDIQSHEQGNAQAGLLHGNLLHGAYLVAPHGVEHRSQFASGDESAQLGVHRTAGTHIAAGLQVQLPDFLTQRHLRHQFADKRIHLLVTRLAA